MPKFKKKFGMTFAKNMTHGVPEFAGTEVNQYSGNLKGLIPCKHTKNGTLLICIYNGTKHTQIIQNILLLLCIYNGTKPIHQHGTTHTPKWQHTYTKIMLAISSNTFGAGGSILLRSKVERGRRRARASEPVDGGREGRKCSPGDGPGGVGGS